MDPVLTTLAVTQGLSLLTGAAKKQTAYTEAYEEALRIGAEEAAMIRLEGSIKVDELRYKAKLQEGITTSKLAGQNAPLTGSALDILMQEARHDDLNIALTDYQYGRAGESKIRAALIQANRYKDAKSNIGMETLLGLTGVGLNLYSLNMQSTQRDALMEATIGSAKYRSEAGIKRIENTLNYKYGAPNVAPVKMSGGFDTTSSLLNISDIA